MYWGLPNYKTPLRGALEMEPLRSVGNLSEKKSLFTSASGLFH